MGSSMRPAILVAGLLVGLLAVTLTGVQGEELDKVVPSEAQCRPYIEKALKDLGTEDSEEQTDAGGGGDEDTVEEAKDEDNSGGDDGAAGDTDDDKSGSREKREVSSAEDGGDDDDKKDDEKSDENEAEDQVDTAEVTTEDGGDEDNGSIEVLVDEAGDEEQATAGDSKEDDKTQEADGGDDSKEDQDGGEDKSEAGEQDGGDSKEDDKTDEVEVVLLDEDSKEQKDDTAEEADDKSGEAEEENKSGEESGGDSKEDAKQAESGEVEASGEDDGKKDDSKEADDSKQDDEDDKKSVEEEEIVKEEAGTSVEEAAPSVEADGDSKEEEKKDDVEDKSKEDGGDSKGEDDAKSREADGDDSKAEEGDEASGSEESGDDEESSPEEEELIMEIEIPEVLRPRNHINQLLKLDEENENREKATEKVSDVVLRDLKKLYDNAIKPLETLYKYRDLSNRHFGDPEIFSKPLVLFMGPWSGGKSSIINYLLDIEYKPTSLRTGAEPSPAYFNIVMHGEEEEILDGTQLAADWTFSGLQKFGQGLLDRLKGYKLNNKLLEKVNIVEIPGILEIRKQVQRLFPFNDACQWFIDRADIIFLVYDPSKLDVGPETEAILDQLKGREYQTRIILNKADQVKPEELMRVQGALIWNISPLMSSAEPPIMYSTSLWSIPYESGSPTRLLYAQERAFLRDLRSAVDKRVEHKIASARRFAVRVRNHAKMVDCYLTTYYNHKGFFSKKKDVSDGIIENPQDYHIYEGLSTLTNISRYDLPDPDVYRDFFRLNPLYDFPLLSSTCTYFRGCPINRLDVAIAYDLPELVGKYKKAVEAAVQQQIEAAAAVPGADAAAAARPTPAQQQQQQKSGAARMTMS